MANTDTELKQIWRIYSPEGRDTIYGTKATLKNRVRHAIKSKGEIYVRPSCVTTGSDDAYSMIVDKENVMVVAREQGQIDYISGVFDDVKSGIFFHVSDENFREAESKLAKAFG